MRSIKSKTGYTKLHAIKTLLDTVIKNTVVSILGNNYTIHSATPSGGIAHLGQETPESKRVIFTMNYLVKISKN